MKQQITTSNNYEEVIAIIVTKYGEVHFDSVFFVDHTFVVVWWCSTNIKIS